MQEGVTGEPKERPNSERFPDSEWSDLLLYGTERVATKNIEPEDVRCLVDEYRTEIVSS